MGAAPVCRARAAGRLCFTQDESLAILGAYGIPTIPTRFAASPMDAGIAADLLGYPAVVKLRDSAAPADRLPSSLVFDLHDASHIVAAARLLTARALRHGGTGELVVQRHAGRGSEVAIRVSDDAHIRADDRVRRRGHDVQPSRSCGRSAAVEPGVGAWADRAKPYRRDAWANRCGIGRPPNSASGGGRCWCGSAS